MNPSFQPTKRPVQERTKTASPGLECTNGLAKKLQELSFEEREKALHELHGISDVVEETEEVVRVKLQLLDKELEQFPETSALKLAMAQNIEYVNKTRIMFLRADQFNVPKSATRIGRFFELKRKVVDENKLAQDITWNDLSENDKRWLKLGSLQLLSQRDRAGRAVLFRFGPVCTAEDCKTSLRLICFMTMRALEDEEIQKRGMVFIQYNVGAEMHVQRAAPVAAAVTSLPIRLAASHLCYNNPEYHAATKIIEIELEKHDVCKFRTHFGSNMVCQYALMSFGISKEIIPLTPDGELKLSFHHQWLKQLEKEPVDENQNTGSKTGLITVPAQMDVVLGRGRHGESCPGNLRFKHLLSEFKDSYDSVSKNGKAQVVDKVLKDLQDSGSRFIKRDGKGWIQILDSAARAKISHAFRNLRTNVSSSNVSKAQLNKRDREWDLFELDCSSYASSKI